jgi:NAD(P)-dependent dehydrogenase (short-subunit alcohol dehydrogenase family)
VGNTPARPLRLEGEVAIVTGATMGLGREIARLFGSEGCAVVLTGRDHDRGSRAARDVEDEGGAALFVPADLRREADCQALVDATLAHFGSLTVLVNNAVNNTVMADDGPVADVDRATFDAVLAVNLVGPATLSRLAIPAMLDAGHGAIVNVSSRAAERGTPNLAAYTAMKGGLNALALSISIDHARQGIRCNTVQPGYVLNDERDAELSVPRMERYQGMHLTRMTTANDVALAALFLASRESEVITGVTLQVDSGSTSARGLTLG